MSAASGAGQREVAYRLFAAEFDDADFSYSEGEEERAPNYVITPTGARVNRLFAVGVLTEVEHVNEEMVRARVVDPTGAFVVYAGQYQPDALTFLERADPPMFVAVTGKARTFQPEDSDRVFTSVRPESVNEVDAETRDRWTVGAAEHTLDRVATVAAALEMERRGDELREVLVSNGVDEGLAAGIALAIDHYGTTPAYLGAIRDMAVDALRVVAGERDEVQPPGLAPDEDGHADLDGLKESAVSPGAPEPAGGGTDPDTDVTAPDVDPGGGPTGPVGEAGEETPQSDRPAEGAGDIGDFDSGEFDLEDDERDRIESEYGTEFETGAEVDGPGEADIGVGGTEEGGEAPDTGASASDTGATASRDDVEEERGAETEEPTDGAVDLEDAAVDAMRALDEGDGADREAVIGRVTERAGASRDDVTAAIRDALMEGRCYEPDDETLKPI